jgi:hypothetical protein
MKKGISTSFVDEIMAKRVIDAEIRQQGGIGQILEREDVGDSKDKMGQSTLVDSDDVKIGAVPGRHLTKYEEIGLIERARGITFDDRRSVPEYMNCRDNEYQSLRIVKVKIWSQTQQNFLIALQCKYVDLRSGAKFSGGFYAQFPNENSNLVKAEMLSLEGGDYLKNMTVFFNDVGYIQGILFNSAGGKQTPTGTCDGMRNQTFHIDHHEVPTIIVGCIQWDQSNIDT